MKNILITGANRGLGLEFTKQYLESGCTVYACCRTPESATALSALKAEFSNNLIIAQVDVGDLSSIKALAVQYKQVALDTIISNAGVYGAKATFQSTDYNEWLKVMQINTFAFLQIAQNFHSHLLAGKDKKLIAITSKMGSVADNTSGGSYIYRTSKSALNILVKSLSIDLAHDGIKVLALHPGWVQTDMGGANALTSIPESISGMKSIIEAASDSDSGAFYDFKGSTVPW